MATKPPTHRLCLHHSKWMLLQQYGLRLFDMSLSECGRNIAVSSWNKITYRTSIHVYSVKQSVARDTLKISYSKEFENYRNNKTTSRARFVSFVHSCDDNRGLVVATCLGDKLELFDFEKDQVLKSQKVTLVSYFEASSLCAKKAQLFIGCKEWNKIAVYNVKELNAIKLIILQGIQNVEYPADITNIDDKVIACVNNDRAETGRLLVFAETTGESLCEVTNPVGTHWHPSSITVCLPLGTAVVAWVHSFHIAKETRCVIVFYSLMDETDSSFLVVEVDPGVDKIRISDRGDRMVTVNNVTGEVKVYDTVHLFTYNDLKEFLGLRLTRDDCLRLARFFNLPRDQTYIIERTSTPGEILLLSLEEKSLLEENNLDNLTEAFNELHINSLSSHVTDIYQMTRNFCRKINGPFEALSGQTKSLNLMDDQSEEGKVIPEATNNKTPWTCHQASNSRIYYYNTVTRQATWEYPEDLPKDKSEDDKAYYLNLSTQKSEFLPESSVEAEYGKFAVKVSEKLTKSDCVRLATFFNFPAARMERIRNDLETPGITLIDIMKERHVISIDNVVCLHEALEELKLRDISDNLVTPYQRRIDRLKFEKEYLETVA